MKRFFTAFIAIAVVLTITGCGKGESSEKSKDKDSGNESSAVETTVDGKEQSATQPDPLNPENKTTTEKNQNTVPAATTSAVSTNTPVEKSTDAPVQDVTTVQQDPLYSDSFVYNDGGAVIFKDDSAKEKEEILLAAAQALFESACHTQWNFTVGCPYETDPDDFIETDFDWRFYRIQDGGIRSVADVEDDYYKVFSRRYPNTLSEIFIDGDGVVYALNAARGADIFYTGSEITGVQSKTDDEIFFTVENHYSGTDLDINTPYTQTDTFSIVIESDGSWHAGQFRLPY